MTQRFSRNFNNLASARTRGRERPNTPVVATVVLAILAVACGGGHHGDTYARATEVQQQCCEHLAGAAREACLQKIIRVGDPEVAKTSVNQQQYACVEEHFACDAQTGHATQPSAQAQLDCIQDLQ